MPLTFKVVFHFKVLWPRGKAHTTDAYLKGSEVRNLIVMRLVLDVH